MRIIVPTIAGILLFVVGVQGAAFLTRYGLLPLPAFVGRLDFTPQYSLLAVLVVVAALVGCFDGANAPGELEKDKPMERSKR